MKNIPLLKFFSNVFRLLVELRRLLGRQNDAQILWMLIMMATIAALDLVGVGAIYPLLSIAINPSEVNQSWWMQWIQKSFGEIPLSMLMIIIAVALLFIYVFKAFITSYGNYYQYQFSYRFSAFLAHRVLKGYLSLAYPFFLTQNSSVLLKNVLTETNLITVGVLIPLLSLLSDNVVIIPLCILLIVISPAVYLYAGIAVAALFAISFLILRHRIITWGNEREQLSGEVNRVVHQSLFGVKEVKAINCEEVYLQRLIKGLSRYATLATYHVFFQSAPRIWIDFLIMTGLVIFILLTQQSNVNYSQLAPVLGVYVAAFYRILPLFNRTFTNVTTIAYYQASVFAVREALEGIEALEREEKLLDTQKGKIPTLRESICFKEVSYQYPLADQHSVYNINLEIPYGSRVAIVGASGAGKTTTVDLLLGLLEPTKGEIVIDGIHLTQRNSRSWREQIGYVSQQIFIADATLEENIAFGISIEEIDRERLAEAIDMAGLTKVVDNLEKGIKTPLGENGVRLSGGERQRIGIARALYRKPRLLVLDEATSALDVMTEHQIMKDIFSLGRDTTIVIISHRVSAVQPCDKLYFLKNGRLAASGTYHELLETVPDFSEMVSGIEDNVISDIS